MTQLSPQQYEQNPLWLRPGETPEIYQARVSLSRASPAADSPGTPTTQATTPSFPSTQVQYTQVGSPSQIQNGAAGMKGGMLTMPVSGSVVDLLNMAGRDSSFASRQNLAKQYGIQGYTGTSSQNLELGKKYTDAFNASKTFSTPQSGAEAREKTDVLLDSFKETDQDPFKASVDLYASMDPVQAKVFDTIGQIMSSLNTNQTFQEELSKILGPELEQQRSLFSEGMDLRRLMEGQEDSVRKEIAAAGGLATEQQVQNITTARNKTLLKRANQVSDELGVLDNYIDRVTALTKADREETKQNLMDKLGLSKTLFDMGQSMNKAARENYQTIIENVGYSGLSQFLQGDANSLRQAESALGLPKGALSNPDLPDPIKIKTSKQESGGTASFMPSTPTYSNKGGLITELNPEGFVYGTPEYSRSAIQNSIQYGDRRLLQDERQNIDAAKRALNSLGTYNQLLQGELGNAESKEVFGERTGVISGRLRTLASLWGSDANAAAINAVITGIIPTVARGIFQEVGVLTDADIKNYKKTIPDINKPEGANKLVELVLLKTLEGAYTNTLVTAAQNQTNVSNFLPEYDNVVHRLGSLSGFSVKGSRTGTLKDGTKVTQHSDGTITDAKGNAYDKNGNKITGGIPWNALILK